MAQQHESIWGTINTTLEIALNIYYLVGEKGSGLKMPASYGDNPKLQKFLEMGDRDGDYLYFPESGEGFEELKDAACSEYPVQPSQPEASDRPMKEHESYSSYAPSTLPDDSPLPVEDDREDGEEPGEDEYDGFEP